MRNFLISSFACLAFFAVGYFSFLVFPIPFDLVTPPVPCQHFKDVPNAQGALTSDVCYCVKLYKGVRLIIEPKVKNVTAFYQMAFMERRRKFNS